MAFPIAFVHIATAMAGPTAVARIDEQQRYACPLGFVDQELPQLPKTPIMLLAALRFANRDPVAHVRQLFEHKRGFCVFRIRHKAFTQRVIGGSLEAGLCSRHLLQAPLGAFGVRRLVGFASRGRRETGLLQRHRPYTSCRPSPWQVFTIPRSTPKKRVG